MLSIIVAMTTNYKIGDLGRMPFYIPTDLTYFKETTMGKKVIMGRNTYHSIGKVLPGRENIILSTNKQFMVEGAVVKSSKEEVLAMCDPDQEHFVIGGEQIYTLFLPEVEKLYITEVKKVIAASTNFPLFPKGLQAPGGFLKTAEGPWQEELGETFRFTCWERQRNK